MTYQRRAPRSVAAITKRDWVGTTIALAGILVSATIGLSTYATTSAKQAADGQKQAADLNDLRFRQMAANYTNFRAASTEEANFWRGLYDDYLSVLDVRFEEHPEWRREKLLAIYDIAQSRPIPDFGEFGVLPARKTEMSHRLELMRSNIFNLIEDRSSQSNDPLLVAEILRRSTSNKPAVTAPEGAQDVEIPSGPENAAPNPKETSVFPAAIPLNASLKAPPLTDHWIPYSPVSANGWDIDIFWCAGAVQQDLNFQRADMLGRALGNLAVAGRAIGPGIRLGQVRSRPASQAYQDREHSAAVDNLVVADSGPGESEAGQAILNGANVLLGSPLLRQIRSIGRPTRWYISIFLCERHPQASDLRKAYAR